MQPHVPWDAHNDALVGPMTKRKVRMMEKTCPVILRTIDGRRQVLAFVHPIAGCQFVKGSITSGETPDHAARRELFEESGIGFHTAFGAAHQCIVGPERQVWHLFLAEMTGLPIGHIRPVTTMDMSSRSSGIRWTTG
jgi:8-oxo-dGTP pyrophosphatase MutT (NUDIX family)